ncbi:hypothetical protein ELQ35_13380 [Peribacillus cavernae]|uniref:Peptidase M3A/M3B catalytic domain-containing protein n=1 Tax=Peribacillus cavernae TaxID=1674310 RepID=A0A3S0VLJ4_9BACI|nr:hypothetical protein [Peribacillus cavernae]MDQ0217766.1 hypothetical protein [Peribacillus cavernae]RUQ28221.1 hypothetical protein ELQ35_13380 [Peribacillus cavernae]
MKAFSQTYFLIMGLHYPDESTFSRFLPIMALHYPDEDTFSRLFTNFVPSDNARILAHEIGHAWHFQQLKREPSLWFSEETFEMTIAKTSSPARRIVE